jgi:prevent-host-death family protein
MKTVTAAYAKSHLPELLKAVSQGSSVTISRYNKPIADLIPSAASIQPSPKLGTLAGKIKLLDPHCFDPMTDAEAEAFIEGDS